MKRHSFKDWFLATRPWSYPASTMPVAVIIAYVFWLWSKQGLPVENPAWMNGVLAFITMALFQASGNVWSDLHDYKSGVDTDESYGVKILTSGEFSPREIHRLAVGLMCATLFAGCCLVWLSGWPTAIFGIVGMLFTVYYPKLKYNALGDVDIFFSYGLLPTIGTAYVLTGTMVWPVLWLSIPIGLITVAILHVNNTRDASTDGSAGIRTFAMLIGYRASKAVYIAEITVPFVAVVILVGFSVLPVWSLVSLLALMPSLNNVRIMMRSTSGNLSGIVALDASTAQLQLMFSLLLSVSLIISSII